MHRIHQASPPLPRQNQSSRNWWPQPSQAIISTEQDLHPMNSGFPRSAVVSNAQHPQFHSLPHHMQAQRPPVFRRPPWENSNPFVLLPIYGRIKKCAGCPFEFRDPKGPPYLGLVLQHKEKDIYFRDGIQHISGEQNRYYHCNVNCLNSRHPYFTPSLVQIPVGMQLSNEQKTLIDQGIGLKL